MCSVYSDFDYLADDVFLQFGVKCYSCFTFKHFIKFSQSDTKFYLPNHIMINKNREKNFRQTFENLIQKQKKGIYKLKFTKNVKKSKLRMYKKRKEKKKHFSVKSFELMH